MCDANIAHTSKKPVETNRENACILIRHIIRIVYDSTPPGMGDSYTAVNRTTSNILCR